MTTFSHAVTYAHRDWIALGVQVVAPLGSLLVSGVALFFSYRTARQAAQTSERQADIAEAKLIVDQFDRRYEAWKALNEDAEGFFNHAMNVRSAEISSDQLDPTPLNRVNVSINRMYFLFGEEVYERTKEVHATLKSIFRARAEFLTTYVENRNGPLVDGKRQDVDRAIAVYEAAMDDLRRAVRSEMALPTLPPPVAH